MALRKSITTSLLFSEVLNGARESFYKLNALAEPLPVLRRPKNQQHWSGAPNEDIVQNHLNIALLNVF